MPRITPIPTTRISDLFSRQRVLSQLGADQIDLQRLQTQISTGRRVQLPSDDAPAALRGIALQRLIEQKTQARTNLQINQSYLSATDSALSNISNLLTDSRAAAQGVLGTLSTAEQRESAATQIDRALEQLIDAGNQKFRGRYLFAGSKTTQLRSRVGMVSSASTATSNNCKAIPTSTSSSIPASLAAASSGPSRSPSSGPPTSIPSFPPTPSSPTSMAVRESR